MISCITAKPADKESLVLVIPEKSWYNLNYEKRSQRIRGYPMSNGSVSVSRVARVLNLKNFTDEIDLKKCKIISSDVNRPALQLTGYFEHFEESRIQLIGNVEYTFIQQMSEEEKKERYNAFLKFDIPCVIFCRDLEPDPVFLM